MNIQKEEKRSIWGVKMCTKVIVLMGLLAAIEIIFERFFVVETSISRVSFTFVARAISGVCLGPIPASVVGVVADITGALLKGFPINPGITFAALLRGLIYGFFLFRKQTKINILFAATTEQIVCSLLITTASLCLWNGVAFTPEFMLTRLVQFAVMLPVQIVVLFTLQRVLFPKLKTMVVAH